jgi:hypothetical protein
MGSLPDTQEGRDEGRVPSAATTLERLRRMTPEQLDAARICRRCWEHYGVCVCGERKVRGK